MGPERIPPTFSFALLSVEQRKVLPKENWGFFAFRGKKSFYKIVGRIPTDSLKNFFEIFGVPEIALQFLRISVG